MGKIRRKRGRRLPGACPCASGQSYGACCRPFHEAEALPQTPEVLMRSRYSAYAKGLVDYVVATTDRQGDAWEEDEAAWRASIAEFGRSTSFEGVEVLDASHEGDRGSVRFRARLSGGGRDLSFTETSRFVRRDGRWLYHDGVVEG